MVDVSITILPGLNYLLFLLQNADSEIIMWHLGLKDVLFYFAKRTILQCKRWLVG